MSPSRGAQPARRAPHGARRWWLLAVLLLVPACHRGKPATRPAAKSEENAGTRIPRDASRFDIVASDDSTVTFRIMEATWVRAGLRAHAVDPRQHDALIARLTITSVDSGGAHARITGKLAEVLPDHVVLLTRERKPWWRDRRFWFGAGAGAAFGAAVGVGASAGR